MSLSYAVRIFLLGILPISELRGAIPLGILHYHLPLGKVLMLALSGNILVAGFLLLFLNSFLKFLSKYFPPVKKVSSWLFFKTEKRHQKKFARWGNLALVAIVAIPLPFTGAWTGVVASILFGIKPKVAFPLITLGILIAGLIVTLLTLQGILLFG